MLNGTLQLNMTHALDNALITKKEVARLLNVSVMTISRMMKRRELPYITVRSRIRFRIGDIEDYLASRRVESKQRRKP